MFLYGPFERDSRVEREARSLVGAGYEVEVIALAREGLAERETRDGYAIRRVPAEGSLARTFRGVFEAPLGPIARLAFRGAAMFRMRTWARRAGDAGAERPAALLIGHDLDALPAAVRAKGSLGAPLIYDAHELFPDMTAAGRPQYELRGWIRHEARMIKHADAVFAVTPSRARVMAERFGIPAPRVIRNMPDTGGAEQPASDLREGVPDASRVVFYSGNMQPARGLEQAIIALADLEGCVLVVMGSGDDGYVQRLRALAADAGVGDRIFFRDPVRPHEVVAVTASADVGVVLNRDVSLNNYFSLPNKVFEYIVAGLPVVTSDSPDMTELVRRYDVGETCDPDDPVDVARAVRAALADSDRLRANARRAAPELTWKRESEEFLTAVREVSRARG
jgi:glycosyltransferase involved in cell wall biosynthesis